jgi:hypothetical protein
MASDAVHMGWKKAFLYGIVKNTTHWLLQRAVSANSSPAIGAGLQLTGYLDGFDQGSI